MITLRPVYSSELAEYKKEMQRAFQLGAEAEYGETDMQILPEADIDRALSTDGAIAYAAVLDDDIVGGAIVVIDEQTQHNHLDFLFVKVGIQSKGIGQAIWSEIERLHPDTKVWETCTPYFEKRNITFILIAAVFTPLSSSIPSTLILMNAESLIWVAMTMAVCSDLKRL